MSNLVVLRSYPDRIHAEFACSYLESEGIDAVVCTPSEQPEGYLIAEWGEGGLPHELKVAEEDQAAAEAALAETERADWDLDDADDVAPPTRPPADAAPNAKMTDAAAPLQSGEEVTAVCPACGGDPARGDRAIVLGVKGAFWGTGLYVVIALACLPFTEALNVWLALSILGMIIPVALFVVRGFFVRARCGGCGQMRVPKADRP